MPRPNSIPRWLWWARGDFVGSAVIALAIASGQELVALVSGRTPSLLGALSLFVAALLTLFVYTRWASIGTAQAVPITKTYGPIYACIVIVLACGISFWIGMEVGETNGPAKEPAPIVAKAMSNNWGLIKTKVNDVERVKRAYVEVSVSELGLQANAYNFVVVARVQDLTVDQATDQRIDVSSPFSVVVGRRTIEIPISESAADRLTNGGRVELFLIALPSEFNPRQIVSLASLSALRAQVFFGLMVGA